MVQLEKHKIWGPNCLCLRPGTEGRQVSDPVHLVLVSLFGGTWGADGGCWKHVRNLLGRHDSLLT